MTSHEYSKRNLRDILNELIERTNSMIMRLRIVEQRNKTSMTKMNSLQTTAMEQVKESKNFIKSFEKKMETYKEKMLYMENMLKDMSKKINNTATKTELRGLEEMIRIYDPVKSQFVTKRELKEFLKQKTKQK